MFTEYLGSKGMASQHWQLEPLLPLPASAAILCWVSAARCQRSEELLAVNKFLHGKVFPK